MALDGVPAEAADVPFAMAVVVVAVTFARLPAARGRIAAQLAAGLGLALELLLAAGLLRLASLETFPALASVAAIVLLRRVLATGLRYAVVAFGGERPGRLRA